MRRNQIIRDGEPADQLVSRSVLGSHLARAQCAETVTSHEWRMEDHSVGLLTPTLVVLPVPIKGMSHWNSLFTTQLTEGPLEEVTMSVAPHRTNASKESGPPTFQAVRIFADNAFEPALEAPKTECAFQPNCANVEFLLLDC